VDDADDGAFKEFGAIFAKFAAREDGFAATYVKPEEGVDAAETEGGVKKEEGDGGDAKEENDGDVTGGESSDDEDEISRKKKKLATRMKIAELKQHCAKPEVVEVWDTTAADPRLLVYLKAYRNTIPVPGHWSQKRKFLQGKRGIEKPPWQLPGFIEATGIQKLRDSYAEKEDSKRLKQKGKDRTTAKLGKIDIDYQVLHDAFFKFQTKPKMSKTGELYFEGKEFEMDLGGKKPGMLSEEVKEALGMSDDGPPPWLINMQRYGPPPSYPNLKIPGLSAPIPPGAAFGYHPGGWGKPPVDEYGNPIYGDVFGVYGSKEHDDMTPYDAAVDKTKRWGQLEELSESESEYEEDDEDDEQDGTELGDDDVTAGISSMSSLQTGVETPAAPLDLRKRSGPASEPEAAAAPKELYQVLQTKDVGVAGSDIMGSAHTYVVPSEKVGLVPGSKEERSAAAAAARDGTAIALNPEDLEKGLDEAGMAARYAAEVAAQKASAAPEDFSDMVADQARRAKRKADQKGKDKDAKKFKF
jgi:splicing factor 3B subunit 2